jgi:hypothetical protein
MTTSNASNVSTPNRRVRRSVRNAAVGAVAVMSLAAAWATTHASAGADEPSSPVERTELQHTPEFDAAISRFAMSRGLSGLSPASLSTASLSTASLSSAAQDAGCRGLSLASATGCTASELRDR